MSLFAVLPLFSLISPLILLPVLARTADSSTWAAVAVGQSIGTVGQLVITWGWTLTGPAIIARGSCDERVNEVRVSLRVRLVLAAVCLPVLVLVASVLAPPGREFLAASMAVSFSLLGLSPTWYAIGIGRAGLILRFEVIPRTIALLLAATALVIGAAAWTYPVLLVIGTVVGQSMFYAGFTRMPEDGRWISATQAFRRNISAAATEALTGAYSASTIALASIGASTATLSALSGADRVYRLGGYALIVSNNALQGHVSGAHGGQFVRRVRKSLLLHCALGVLGAVVLSVLGPPVTAILFAGQLLAPHAAFVLYGVAFLAVAINTASGRHVLAPVLGSRPILLSTAAGAVVGVPALIAAGFFNSPVWIAAAFALSEIVVTVVQMLIVIRLKLLRTVAD